MPLRTSLAALSGVAGTLAVGSALFATYRRLARHQRAEAAKLNDLLPVHSAWWRARFDHKGALLYVALGDSAAQGIGASSPGRSYVGRLSTRLRAATHSSLRVVNLSVSGATTWLCRRDQLPKLEKYEPDIVTCAIGANDIIDYDPEAFERNIRHVYAALPSHAIVADLPCMWIPDREKKVAHANAVLRRVAEEHGLTVAPLYATTRAQGFLRTYRNSAGDLFHPNDRGYRVWASAFEPAIAARVARIAADRAVSDADATVHDSAAAGTTARAAERAAGRASRRGTGPLAAD
jgi:acyl-CoA thioesterase-1